jgi:hypothetical protein
MRPEPRGSAHMYTLTQTASLLTGIELPSAH